MNNELDALRRRVQELEAVALEYERLSRLIDHAAQDQDIARYAVQSVLQVDPATQRIIAANAAVLDLLGYPEADLLQLPITDLELHGMPAHATHTYSEPSIEEHTYPDFYRHHLGHQLSVQVYKRSVRSENGTELHYRLEDNSLHSRLLHELHRREDSGFKFQQKLRLLNEITIELSHIDTYDAVCQQAVQLGIDHLGFDRLSIWFLADGEERYMLGSYGVDEHGVVRDERDQRWAYGDTYIMGFLTGKTDAAMVHADVPLYNDKSQIIHYGWHLAAPILHGTRVIGVLMADNYLRRQSLKSYEPELLRQYGITIGHLTELARNREQAFALRLEQERAQLFRHFIADVAHDFRTPLAVIKTQNYLIRQIHEPIKQRPLTDIIEQQVNIIHSMFERMLEFTALVSDPALTLGSVQLHTLLTDVVDSHQPSLAKKRIRLELTTPTLPTIAADAHYLRRAVSELLDNAINYTPFDGWIRVTLAHTAHEITIRVQDNGVGIEKDALDQIFAPLFRVDQARVERRNGLGLAIAKIIVDAHHGRITATSVYGQGSTFEINLPQT